MTRSTILSSVAFFWLIGSYYFLKPLRKPLVVSELGFENLHYFYLVTPVVTLVAVAVYRHLVARATRLGLVRICVPGTILVVACFAAPEMLAEVRQVLPTGVLATAFFFFSSIYVLILASLFWSLNDEIFLPREAERGYPFIALGAQVGVVASSYLTGRLVSNGGTEHLLLLTGVSLLLFWASIELNLRSSEVGRSVAARKPVGSGSFTEMGPLLREPYVRALLILTLLANFADAVFDYQFIGLIDSTLASQNGQVELLAQVNLYSGVANIFLCLVLVPLLLRMVGPLPTLAVYPLVLAISAALLASSAPLSTMLWCAVALTSVLHALYDPVREIFYVPTDSHTKYQLKSVNDTVVVKVGSAAGSATIALYAALAGAAAFAGLSVVLLMIVPLWVPFLRRAGKDYGVLSERAVGRNGNA